MEKEDKELQLLHAPHNNKPLSSRVPRWRTSELGQRPSKLQQDPPPSLDLQLSISVRPFLGPPPSSDNNKIDNNSCVVFMQINSEESVGAEALKWHAAEQIRLAALEKAYAERVRELTRREMELAQSQFARARQMWERAREEVDRADKLKQMAMRTTINDDPTTCMEVTSQACRQIFRP